MKYEDVKIGETYYIADRFSDIIPVIVYKKEVDQLYNNGKIYLISDNAKKDTFTVAGNILYKTKKEILTDKLKDLIRDIENKEEELENLKEEKEAVLNEMEYCNE